MNRYELCYIIPTTFTDEEVGGVETKVAGLIAKAGASIESTKRLGKFRFTYPIQHQHHGHYVMAMISAEPSMIAKIEELLRIEQNILRHLLLKAEDAGSDQKFELVQFAEVTVEGKDDRPRRREKTAAASTEAEKTTTTTSEISSEDLDKKIETALSEDVKEA